MQRTFGTKVRTRSELIAEALGETVAELRLIDAADLIGYIKAEQWANISDLVQSSAELSFEDGALSFACTADFEVNWGNPPSISLELEFQHSDITAFFTLLLGPSESLVLVKTVWFAIPPVDEETGTRALADALRASKRMSMSEPGALA